MPKISDLTNPEAVRRAITEHDAIGRTDFLAKYGYGRARTWMLVHGTEQYDSKAIAGAALKIQYGVRAKRIHGGITSVVPRLRDLGFQVINRWEPDERAALPEELIGQFEEGAGRTITVDRLERSAPARAACISIHGAACSVCDLDFASTYGGEFAGLIHVHHLKPLGRQRGVRAVDPARDLVPVCPNCHAAIHFHRKTRSVEQMRGIVSKHRGR
jgi:5-methylcytosine-specific restriction protein A